MSVVKKQSLFQMKEANKNNIFTLLILPHLSVRCTAGIDTDAFE